MIQVKYIREHFGIETQDNPVFEAFEVYSEMVSDKYGHMNARFHENRWFQKIEIQKQNKSSLKSRAKMIKIFYYNVINYSEAEIV